ncbi:hypothetical protein AA313_de0203455 [Arthrobotrys entomopaga]|nr:hypothetical protein AA313_de0203455 [Arthrobotrys entomopaga]
MEAGPSSSSTSKNATGQSRNTTSARDYSDVSATDALKQIDDILSHKGKLCADRKQLMEFDLWLKGFLYSKGWWVPKEIKNPILRDWDGPQSTTSIFHGSVFEKPGTKSSKPSGSSAESSATDHESLRRLRLHPTSTHYHIPGRQTTAQFLNPQPVAPPVRANAVDAVNRANQVLAHYLNLVPTWNFGISTVEHTFRSLIVPGCDIPPPLRPWRDLCHRLRTFPLRVQPYIYIPGVFPLGAYPPGFPMGIFPPGVSPAGGFPPGPYPDGAFPAGIFPPNVLQPGEELKVPCAFKFAPIPPGQSQYGPNAENPLFRSKVLPFNIADPRTLEEVMPEGIAPLFDRSLTKFELCIGSDPELDKYFEPKYPAQNPDGTFKMSTEELEKRLETLRVQVENHKWNVKNRYVGPDALMWHMGPEHVERYYDMIERQEAEFEEHVKKHGFLDLDPDNPPEFTDEEKRALCVKWFGTFDEDQKEKSENQASGEMENPGDDTESEEEEDEPELERDPFFNDEEYAADEATSEEESESDGEQEEEEEGEPQEGEPQEGEPQKADPQKKPQREKKKHRKRGFYLQDFDEDYIESLMAQLPPMDPAVEADMIAKVQPALDQLAREAEAQQAAREERKRQIEEQRHPKFIGPMPQMVIDGKPKRVSMANLIEENGGKNPFAPQPKPAAKKAAQPKRAVPAAKKGRVSILTLQAEKQKMANAQKSNQGSDPPKDAPDSGPSGNSAGKGKAQGN